MSDRPSYQDLEKRVRELQEIESDYRHLKKSMAEQREWYASLFDHVGDSIFVVDVESGFITYCNRQATLATGYTHNELLQMTPFDLEAGLSHVEVKKRLQGNASLAQTSLVEGVVRRKNGSTFPVEIQVSFLDTTDRRHQVAILRDISERKRAETILRENEQRLRCLADNLLGGLFFQLDFGLDGSRRDFTFISAGVKALHDVSPEEAMADPALLRNHIVPEDQSRFAELEFAAQERLEPFMAEVRMLMPHSGERWHLILSSPTRLADGRLVWDGFELDITDRKKVEVALAESEKRLRTLADNIPGGMVYRLDFGPDGSERRFSYVSAGVKALHNLIPAEVLKDSQILYSRMHPDDRERNAGLEAAGEAFSGEFRMVIPGRGERWHFITTTPTRQPDGRLVWDGLELDITDRKKAEIALRESEERFRKIFQEAHLGIVIVQPTFKVESANPAFCRMVGYTAEELKTTTLGAISHPEDVARTRENLARLGRKEIPFYQTEKRYLHKDGTAVWVNLVVSAIRDERDELQYYISTMEDITKRKQAEEEKARLQEQFLQAQKMESVGRLAGGVAHDFNNMLAIILGHTEMALEEVDPAQPLYSDLREIQKAASRSADLTRQLLAFARKQTISPKVLDLNATVGGMLTMLRRLIDENIELEWRPAAGLWQVKIDPSQIDQILANLCVNARDAIEKRGRISIETANVALDHLSAQAHSGCPDGDYVMLAVSDDGHGMDADTRAHIFEPFFTTKGIGEGTGLGLATIYGIVKQNNGFIYAYSEPGQGTTFKIYLPRAAAAPDVEQDSPASTESGGRETILLVEDEPMILEMIAKMLKLKGYTVLTAASPKEALIRADEHISAVDLLLTDVVMPEMNGWELTRLIQERHPDIKALYMSGYTADTITRQGVLDSGMHFIQKPFQMKLLNLKVRQALEGQDPDSVRVNGKQPRQKTNYGGAGNGSATRC